MGAAPTKCVAVRCTALQCRANTASKRFRNFPVDPAPMSKNQDSLFRQWHMLRYVPRHPRRITVRSIQEQLTLDGFRVSDRTVQRDLLELSRVFPLIVDDREKPFGWSWQKDAKAFDLPGLSVAEALTWVLAEQHLGQLLPGSMLEHLTPHFRAARERLDKEPMPRHGRKWLHKVRSVMPAQPLIPPPIDPEVQRAISDAVLQERQVEIRYQTRAKVPGASPGHRAARAGGVSVWAPVRLPRLAHPGPAPHRLRDGARSACRTARRLRPG